MNKLSQIESASCTIDYPNSTLPVEYCYSPLPRPERYPAGRMRLSLWNYSVCLCSCVPTIKAILQMAINVRFDFSFRRLSNRLIRYIKPRTLANDRTSDDFKQRLKSCIMVKLKPRAIVLTQT